MIKLARKIIRKNKFLYNFVCYVFKHTIYRNLFTDIYKSKEITVKWPANPAVISIKDKNAKNLLLRK